MINLKSLLNETFLGGGELPSSKLIKMKQTMAETMADDSSDDDIDSADSVSEGTGDVDRMQEISADFSMFIKKNIPKIKRLPTDKQKQFCKLLGDFKNGLDDLSEGVYESVVTEANILTVK